MAYIIVDTDKLRRLIADCISTASAYVAMSQDETSELKVLDTLERNAVCAGDLLKAYLETGDSPVTKREGPVQS